MEQQSTKYLGSLVNFTRTFLTTNYQKLPIKPPQFVENMIVMANNLSSPYVEGITDLVDNNINKSFQIVQSYEKKIGITEQGSRLKQKGQEIKDSLKGQSKKAIDQGMDLAVKNSASQYLINTCDRVADKVFSSIEGRVEQLQKVVQKGKAPTGDEEQSKFKSTYNKRVTRLAHNITDLSCGLVQLLRKEMQILGGSSYVRVQTMIKQHINSTIYIVKLVIYTPMLKIFECSKQQVINVISILQQKFNNKELISYLLNQLNVLKQQLSISQFKQYYSLLIQSLVDLKIVDKLKQQGQTVVKNYKEQLKNEEVKIVEPLNQQIERTNQLDEQEISEISEENSD